MRVPSLRNTPAVACVVVDLQEKFAPAIPQFECIVQCASKLISGSRLSGVKVFATEQYPKGLGRTVTAVTNALADSPVFEKTSFSCFGAPGFPDALKAAGITTCIVCGVETHVCVLQTVIDCIDRGMTAFVAVDAVGSRSPLDRDIGLKRMEQAGAYMTTLEAALFEMTGGARHEKFKEIQALIK